MTRLALASSLLLLLAAGCANTAELTVDVRTDYAAGVEFDQVIVQVDDTPEVMLQVAPHDDYSDAAHVADYRAVATGPHHVRATLRLGTTLVASSDIWVRVTEPVVVPVTITRTCGPMTCADPTTTCYGGRCLPSMCDPTDATCAARECDDARPCTAVGDCIDVVCARGACLRLPRDERCPIDEYCAPDLGTCAYLPGSGPPGAPVASFDTAMTTAHTLVVRWTDVGRADYVVELATDAAFSSASTTTHMVSGLADTFSGLESGRRYFARVHAMALDAPLSNVVNAITTIASPTGVAISVTWDGSLSRPAAAPDWITSPGGGSTYHYIEAHAAATCASGAVQFRFSALYVPSGGGPYDSPWQGPYSYIVDTFVGYGARFTVWARCVGPDAASAEAGGAQDCADNGGGC